MIKKDYLDFIYEIFTEDELINDVLDKDLELFLDKNSNFLSEDIKIESYKTADELDNVYLFINNGYKIAKIIRHEKFTSIIFANVKRQD